MGKAAKKQGWSVGKKIIIFDSYGPAFFSEITFCIMNTEEKYAIYNLL